MIKNRMLKFTKKEKSNIVDFLILLACSELLLVFFKLNMSAPIDWRYFVALPIYSIFFYFVFQCIFKLNKILWEHASGKPFLILLLILILDFVFSAALGFATFGYAKWLTFYFVTLFLIVYLGLSVEKLSSWQLYLRKHQLKHVLDVKSSAKNNTLIIGAGWTGSAIAKGFANDPTIFKPVCFVDDSEEKQGKQIVDIPVVGTTKDIASVVKKYYIRKIIFAIPTCDPVKKAAIINDCIATKCVLKIIPPVQELVESADMTTQPRDVKIEDLLGREPMTFDSKEVKEHIQGKVVLVTGGGGSIGSELCRQIASFEPKQLIIMEIYENNAYDIQQELKRKYPKLDLQAEICSIADYEKCRILFDRYRPELVFHAAAHKHVPLMETSPAEAIKNNVFGTLNTARAADRHGALRFVMISTDKAVNPTNVMGATKRICEMIIQTMGRHSKTEFVAVRFGNVLGSNGSVIPLFRRQIAEGGPVTLTHKDIIRYFMTIPEAVSLVLQAGAYAKGGEIFVLDMGEPVRIYDLAYNLIKLSGYEPDVDIKIKITGLRPGEKLYEERLMAEEGMQKTANDSISIGRPLEIDENKLSECLEKLRVAAAEDSPDLRALIKELVPTYHYEV